MTVTITAEEQIKTESGTERLADANSHRWKATRAFHCEGLPCSSVRLVVEFCVTVWSGATQRAAAALTRDSLKQRGLRCPALRVRAVCEVKIPTLASQPYTTGLF